MYIVYVTCAFVCCIVVVLLPFAVLKYIWVSEAAAETYRVVRCRGSDIIQTIVSEMSMWLSALRADHDLLARYTFWLSVLLEAE
jgi:hypothetical protein